MRIGVSCLSKDIETAIDICKKSKVFNHIEIGIDNLSECEFLKKYSDEISKNGISVGIHLPMELNTNENTDFIRKSWAEFTYKIIESTLSLKPVYVNMHMGYAISQRLENRRDSYIENTNSFLREFESVISGNTHTISDNICENVDIKSEKTVLNNPDMDIPFITIENSYSDGDGDFSNTGDRVSDFEHVFKSSSALRKNINGPYFCFDTGHNILSNGNYSELFCDDTRLVHLSDNNGIKDTHCKLLSGKLKKEDIQRAISMRPDYAVIETSLNDARESLLEIYEIIKEVI